MSTDNLSKISKIKEYLKVNYHKAPEFYMVINRHLRDMHRENLQINFENKNRYAQLKEMSYLLNKVKDDDYIIYILLSFYCR
jgi:hypothetical protein